MHCKYTDRSKSTLGRKGERVALWVKPRDRRALWVEERDALRVDQEIEERCGYRGTRSDGRLVESN